MLIGYMRPYQDDLKCEEQLKKIRKSKLYNNRFRGTFISQKKEHNLKV
ncbi:hypothetical protein ACT7DG_29935 [Bacillus cereus]